VIDLSYAINDSWCRGRAITRWLSQGHATVERNGYFTRSFWMLDTTATTGCADPFSAGENDVDEIPATKLFGPAVCWMRAQGARKMRITRFPRR